MKHLVSISLFIMSCTLCTFAIAKATPEISQDQLLSLQAAAKAPQFIVLDVRSDEEYMSGHIPNAVNINHDQLTDKLSLLSQKLAGDKSTLIVVHCRSGRRAAMAEEILRDNGFSQVRHLTGDIKAWQQNNLPITK